MRRAVIAAVVVWTLLSCAQARAALSLSFTNTIFGESSGVLSNWGRVHVSPPPGADLAVTLTSSDTTEARVTNTVVVPAGMASAPFDIVVVSDIEYDGSRPVDITASAAATPAVTGRVEVADTGTGFKSAPTILVPAGSVWRYNDTGTDLGTSWRGTGYVDSAWQAGPAQLGYGDGDEATTNSWGSDPANKYITTYYRRSFSVIGVADICSLSLSILRDDGVIAYLNGIEVLRSNMPAGTVGFATTAVANVEDQWVNGVIAPALLREGTNVLAVEIHQSSGNSTDISFDLSMTGQRKWRTRPRVAFTTPLDAYSPGLSTNLAGQDFSGCCIMPATRELMIIRRTESYTYQIEVYSLAGAYLRTIALPNFNDTEGVQPVDLGSNTFAIAEEGTANIVVVTIATNTASVDRSAGQTIEVDFPKGADFNKGLEGAAYDPLNGWFYAVQEQQSSGMGQKGVYRVTGTGTNAVTVDLFDAERVFAGKADDLSDVAYDTYSGHLFILSDLGKTVFECDLSGNIISSRPVPSFQPEGVALSDSGKELYIASETNEYYRYIIPTQTVAEGSSAVYTLSLSAPWTDTVAVAWAVTSGTAVAGADYSPAGGTVIFPPGVVTGSFTVSVLEDTDADNGEVLEVVLTNSSFHELVEDPTRHILIGSTNPLVMTLYNVPFDNEETPDSTPSFEFSAADPDGPAGMIYEVQWTTNAAFASGVAAKVSDSDAGFENTEVPADTNAFTGGQRVRFTIQPENALANSAANAAYYWRVRAKDSAAEFGSGEFGPWATGGSFRVNSALPRSRWLQTADGQFAEGTFEETETNGAGSVRLVSTPQPIAFDSVLSGSTLGGNSVNLQWLTISNVPNRLLLVGISVRYTGISSVKLGDKALTLLDSRDNAGQIAAHIYYMTNPPVLTTNVLVTFAGNTTGTVGASVWHNVDQATPFGTVAKAVGTSAGATVDVSSAAGELVVDAVAVRRAVVPSAGAGQSEQWSLSVGAGALGAGGAGSSEPGGALVKMTWGGFGGPVAWAIVGVPLRWAQFVEGTVASPAIDFNLVPGASGWDELLFGETSPPGDVKCGVQYWSGGTWLDTPITDVSVSPVDISSLDPAVFSRIRLKATLATSGGTPYLDDWGVTWVPPPVLTVMSRFGSPSPSGTNSFFHGTSIVCGVAGSPAYGGAATQFVCAGWTGSGSVPQVGSGTNTGPLTLTNDSTLTWLWTTNVWLTALTNGGGTVAGANRWVPLGSNATAQAATNQFWRFTGWSGDVQGDTNALSLAVTMSAARVLVAHFGEELAAMGTPKLWLEIYYSGTNDYNNAERSDTDRDGAAAWEEHRAHTDPTNAASVIRILCISNSAGGRIVQWWSVTGRTYSVYRTTNLFNGWVDAPLTSGVAGEASGTNTFTEENPPAGRGGYYYQVRVE